jgi:peptidoglycan-associated lipoprotein
MYRTSRALSPLLVILVVAIGCSRKRVSPTPVAPVDRAVRDDGVRSDSLARAEAARRDSLAREASIRQTRERRLAEARATLTAPVYFAFDRSDLSSEARGKLEAKASILNASPGLRVRIEGHTDERGSDEYNLALGQRRAASVRQFLLPLGVSEARLDFTSFGEEKPVCQESVESCWARNRRVEFEIVAGADLIAVQ